MFGGSLGCALPGGGVGIVDQFFYLQCYLNGSQVMHGLLCHASKVLGLDAVFGAPFSSGLHSRAESCCTHAVVIDMFHVLYF